mmetsp:Transcript_34137/g.108808  ORF Transcript_34137/g.108808 Transcript_34137/m.108808 type:complete len:272 (-) Transcript_34137:220-1035(-)
MCACAPWDSIHAGGSARTGRRRRRLSHTGCSGSTAWNDKRSHRTEPRNRAAGTRALHPGPIPDRRSRSSQHQDRRGPYRPAQGAWASSAATGRRQIPQMAPEHRRPRRQRQVLYRRPPPPLPPSGVVPVRAACGRRAASSAAPRSALARCASRKPVSRSTHPPPPRDRKGTDRPATAGRRRRCGSSRLWLLHLAGRRVGPEPPVRATFGGDVASRLHLPADLPPRAPLRHDLILRCLPGQGSRTARHAVTCTAPGPSNRRRRANPTPQLTP